MFHRVWLSDPLNPNPIPRKYEANWSAWRRQFPGEEFRTWTNADIDAFPSVSRLVHEAEGMARKADILRYAILYEWGGVYLDCDLEPYHRPDFLLDLKQLIICSENTDPSICSIGFIAAPKGAPIFSEIIEELQGKQLNVLPPNEETGPSLFGSHVNRWPDAQRLPTHAFYPYYFNEARAAILDRDLGETYGIHQWGGSWLSAAHHTSLLHWKSLHNESLEIEEAICEGKIDPAIKLVEISRGLRKLRQDCTAFAMHHAEDFGGLVIESQKHFEFLKLACWLFENKADMVVWQVGAADGVLVDPVRPLMVRFNPLAVLLEPNPFIFVELKKNYAENDRAVLLNAALTEVDCQVEMNCVDPRIVSAHQLPEWVLGISSFYHDKNVLDGRHISAQLHEAILRTVKRTSVEGLGVKSVLAESGVGSPSVLVIDAEGADAQVIRLILAEGAKPMIIHFEHCNLTDSEAQEITELLAADYVIFKFGNDTTACKTDLFYEYCTFLAVEHGIPNIFGSVLEKVHLFGPSVPAVYTTNLAGDDTTPSSDTEHTSPTQPSGHQTVNGATAENDTLIVSVAVDPIIRKVTRKGLAARIARLADSLRKRIKGRPRKAAISWERQLRRHARYSRRLVSILGAYAVLATIALCLR